MSESALCVLVIEDEALVALELESMLTDDGFAICGVADRKDDALRLAAERNPDVALVDLQLADGFTGPEVARLVADSGCTVIFMTANANRVPDPFPGVLGLIQKPYTQNGLRAALRYVRAYCDGDRSATPPPSFIALNGHPSPSQAG